VYYTHNTHHTHKFFLLITLRGQLHLGDIVDSIIAGSGEFILGYVTHFNFDFIKIDRQFIHSLSSANEDEPLVSAMIAMAKGLKLELIAEGVETEEQKEALIQMGCLYAQGYLYYKPMPAVEFKELLSNYYK